MTPTNKKIIIYSTIIGVSIITYIAYKIISDWDKVVINEMDFKFKISPDASTGVPGDDVVPIKPDEGMMNEFTDSEISDEDSYNLEAYDLLASYADNSDYYY